MTKEITHIQSVLPVGEEKLRKLDPPPSKDQLSDGALAALVDNVHGYVDTGSLLHWQVISCLRELQERRAAHEPPAAPAQFIQRIEHEISQYRHDSEWLTDDTALLRLLNLLNGVLIHSRRTVQPPLPDDARDAARYRWLRGRVLGSEYRRIGFVYSETSDIDAQIDRILAYSGST
jgi:hypothetical protein